MPPLMNPDVLAQLIQRQKQLGAGMPAAVSPASPLDISGSSTGAAVPHGIAPGGDGTALTPPAGPRNPAVISNPDEIRTMQAHILEQMTAPVKVGEPPQAPSLPPAPTMSPYPSGLRGRLVAGLSGIAGQANPLETMRRQQFSDQLEGWKAQVAPLQETYGNQLKAYEAQTKAQMEAAQAGRYGAMASSYLAPYFGISRSGSYPGMSGSKLSNALKFNQGMPVSVTDPQTGQAYPIDPQDKELTQVPQHLRPLVIAAQRQHGAWYGEQQRLIQTRGEAFRLNTMYPVLDSEDGMAPIFARGYEILNNPNRYVAGSLGQMAMNKQNILLDIGDLSKTVRADFHALGGEEFSGEQRALVAAALAAPAGDVGQYVQSFARSGMSPKQSKLATDLLQLKENGMALRGIIPGGATDMMRTAVASTLPGIGTPSVPYADVQLDALDQQIARLSRGIPKVSMRTEGGNIPTAGEGAAPPTPARGPLASQRQPANLPLTSRQGGPPANPQAIQGAIEEYERGPDGKLHLKKPSGQ